MPFSSPQSSMRATSDATELLGPIRKPGNRWNHGNCHPFAYHTMYFRTFVRTTWLRSVPSCATAVVQRNDLVPRYASTGGGEYRRRRWLCFFFLEASVARTLKNGCLSKNLFLQWFFNGFFRFQPLVPMVFPMFFSNPTIAIE